jgi:hypothetical protein
MKNNVQRGFNNFVDPGSYLYLSPAHVICATFRTHFVTTVYESVPCSPVDHRHFRSTGGKKSHSACRLLATFSIYNYEEGGSIFHRNIREHLPD